MLATMLCFRRFHALATLQIMIIANGAAEPHMNENDILYLWSRKKADDTMAFSFT